MSTLSEQRSSSGDPAGAHYLSLLEIDASEIGAHPDLIDRILRHDLFGVHIRGVFDPARLARVVENIEHAVDAPMFRSHTFRGRTYGRVLRMADASLDEYFAAARRIGPALEAAFGEGPGYEGTLRRVLGTLGGSRPVAVPEIDGRRYAPATVRVVDPGGTVDLHCGNETYKFPSLAELVERIDPAGEISTLMPLVWPERGGELHVFDVRFGDPLMRELDDRLGRERAHLGLGDRHRLRIAPGVGDLVLFEEGRYFHRVTEVEGARSRWTMGGFVAPSRDGATLHYWS